MFSKKFISTVIVLTMLITSILPAHAASHEYDALGRLIKTTYSDGDDTNNKSVGYSYDAGGNITAVNGFNVGSTGSESTTEVTTTETPTEATTAETPTETTTEAPVVTNELVWNYTTGENTDSFYTVTANEWKNAVNLTYNDLNLSKAVKMESSTSISFTVPQAGTLKIVTYSTKTAPAVKLNGIEPVKKSL